MGGEESFLNRLHKAGIDAYWGSYSALDRYFDIKKLRITKGNSYYLVNSTWLEFTQLFERIEFNVNPLVDIVVVYRENQYFVKFFDSDDSQVTYPFSVMSLLYNPLDKHFLDYEDKYFDLRKGNLVIQNSNFPWWIIVSEAAQLISRYHYRFEINQNYISELVPTVPIPYQRHILSQLLTSPNPEKGLILLKKTGLVDNWWPEIAAMGNIQHSKDHHPEGNLWEHTMATFKHRKSFDLILSLSLLLHDLGKIKARHHEGKKFYGHAEIGERLAVKFLRRLQFPSSIIQAVSFLTRNHMMVGALNRFPNYRASKVMSSSFFPTLLEVFRADVLSTFSGPEPYFEACKIYKNFKKHSKAQKSYYD